MRMDSKNKIGHIGEFKNGFVQLLGGLVVIQHCHKSFRELDDSRIEGEDVDKKFADLQVHHFNLPNDLVRSCHYFVDQDQKLRTN